MGMDALLVGLQLHGVENHSLSALARAGEDAGFSTTIAPFGGWQDIPSVIAATRRERPRLVGVSIQNGEASLASLMLCRLLREAGFRGELVCGGHFATLNARDILDSPAGVDAVVRYAGEEAWVGLLRGRPRAELPGLVFREGGAVVDGAPPQQTLARPPRPLPLPAHLGFPAADLVLSRGCEARCAYCCVGAASHAIDRGYLRHGLDEISDEVAWLYHERGVRVLNFMDDNLLPLDAGEALVWLRELQQRLRKARVGQLAFSLQLRADVVTEEVATVLAELGIGRAYVGIDGYSQPQLRQLGRRSPAAAGPIAVERLRRRGAFVLCNALLLGPTITFEALTAELDGLAQIDGAPVHLLPIDARRGTPYYENAARKGLIEGGFLWQHHRFADARTARVAEVILACPTRLHERSVPIALYDLGYNLGIARRLYPELDISRASFRYDEIARIWNRDQLRLLGAALDAASDDATAAALAAHEADDVRHHDERLVEECDGWLRDLERAATARERRPVRAHARGSLLSAVALSMGLAACKTRPLGLTDAAPPPFMDMATSSPDLALAECPDGRQPSPELPICTCPYGGQIRLVFDANGVVVSMSSPDGMMLPPDVAMCLSDFFKGYCYPSLANQTKDVMTSHCWVA
jgi:hypothetical protein